VQNQREGRQIAPSRSPIKDLSVYGEGGDLIAVGDGYGKSGRISPAFFRSHRLSKAEAVLRDWQGPDAFAIAVKIALRIEGRIGGNAGSPRPVGELLDFRKCTSLGGACSSFVTNPPKVHL
jgi:hypothetical protein